jgi:hypothetical protein
MNKRDLKKVVGWNVRLCDCGCNNHVVFPVTLADKRRLELAGLWVRTFEGGGTPRLRTLKELNRQG